MARKPKPEEQENHERWLVSYADFITLLFAFFVMMFANAQVEKGKMVQIAEGFEKAIDPQRLSRALSRMAGQEAKPEPVHARQPEAPPKIKVEDLQSAELQPSMERLTASLAPEIKQGRLEVRLNRRGLVISLRQASFFPSGNATLDPSTYSALQRLAESVRGLPNPMRLEGHTDSIPIHTARFQSNWELSSARAITLLELFTTSFGLDANRMAVAGFADTAPVADNKTEEGRARNRRVDIVILSQAAQQTEPEQKNPTEQGRPSTAR